MAKVKHGFTGQKMIILPFYVFQKTESDPLMHDLYIHSIGYFPKAKYHYINRPSGCTEHILIYCKAGKGWVEVENTRQEISAEQFIILSSDTAHKYGSYSKDPWTIYWVHFKGYKSALFSIFFNTVYPVAQKKGLDKKINLFDEMYKILNYSINPNSLLRANLCLPYFLSLFLSESEPEVGINMNYSASVVNLATHYMNENVEKRLKLHDIASHFGYSSSYFYRLFYKSIGYAPIAYFNQLKIQRACHLLLTTDKMVSEISMTLGFEDSLYFSRLFKKITSKSPSIFRRSSKQIDNGDGI